MEAQKVDQKTKRLSDLQFSPGFTITFQLDLKNPPLPLDPEMVLSLIVGIDKRNPWYPPNDIPNEPDHIVVRWIGPGISGGGEVRCTHERNIIREKHLDAYLRYIQVIGEHLCKYLKSHGVLHVEVQLDLTSHVKEFSTHHVASGKECGGGGLMI